MKTTEEMIAVMQAYEDGEKIELRSFGRNYWELCNNPVWNWDEHEYRIAVTQDSIDWSHVHKDFNWMARDTTGEAWLFSTKPNHNGEVWYTILGTYAEAEPFASYRRGTCDWRDSLVERPK